MKKIIYRILASVVYPFFQRKVVDVKGLEHIPTSGGFILACNHVDWLDGFYIGATIQKHCRVATHFLTASNNYWWTTIAVQIPADRSMIISHAVAQLRSGKIICNFVEGERNTTTQLLPGKTGTVRMAIEAGVPVVPVGITCEAGRSMGQSLQYLRSSGHPVNIAFGQPLRFTRPTGELTPEWLSNETQHLMAAIAPLAGKHV